MIFQISMLFLLFAFSLAIKKILKIKFWHSFLIHSFYLKCRLLIFRDFSLSYLGFYIENMVTDGKLKITITNRAFFALHFWVYCRPLILKLLLFFAPVPQLFSGCVCLFVCLSICLCLWVPLSVYLYNCLNVCLCRCVFLSLF